MYKIYKQVHIFVFYILLRSIFIFLRLIDEKSGFNEDRDLLNKLRYINKICVNEPHVKQSRRNNILILNLAKMCLRSRLS